eukprot:548546_1
MSAQEIINLQIGACGNAIGTSFWSKILEEHALDQDGVFRGNRLDRDNELRLGKINSYFYEKGRGILTTGYIRQTIESKYKFLSHIPSDVKLLCRDYIGSFNGGHYVPRSIFVDSDPNTTDIIKTSSIGNLFNSSNFIVGTESCSHNWAKAYYNHELMEETMNVIRFEAENCDSLQGLQLYHSIGGATGSGLGVHLLEKLRDNYPDKSNQTFTVCPSPKVSDAVLEPYNATLSLSKMIEIGDQTFVIDNEALFSLSYNVLKQKEPKYADLNWLTSMVMSGVTSSFRYPVGLNATLKRMGINLVSFPRLHFMLISHAPLFNPGQGQRVRLTVQELIDQIYSSRNFFASVKSEDGKFLSISTPMRGAVATTELQFYANDPWMRPVCQLMADDFVTWIPNNIKGCVCVIPPTDTSMSASMIASTTAIKGVFQRISAQFARLYKRKSCLHCYIQEGLNECQFQESDKNVRDLITEYQDKQDAVVDLEGDSDYDYDEDDEEDYSDYEEDL